MMFWGAMVLTVFGLVHCQETEPLMRDESEWDCSNDHAPHPSDARKFLLSPGGFAEGTAVVEAICPTPLQVFSKITQPDGERQLCRCLYTPELRALLTEECQMRPVSGNTAEYEILVPNQIKQTIEELYQRRSCEVFLPGNVLRFFQGRNVQPLFFNFTGCRCQWTPEAIAVESRPVGEGERCERMVDLNFTKSIVAGDEMGNWVDVFPHNYQRNLTLAAEGGAVFGSHELSIVVWRPAGSDFDHLNLVAQFRASSGSDSQLIFTNMCRDNADTRGFVELRYRPSTRTYSLRFFGDQVAECTPINAPGGFADQVANVIYSDNQVRLEVNGFDCPVSSLNPIPFQNPTGSRRLAFSSKCPFQIGGAVYTDVAQADFGRPDTRPAAAAPLVGTYKRFMVLRDCRNPPQMVLDRVRGLA